MSVRPGKEAWNKLGKVVAALAEKAGIEGRVTNHSCRATAASRMYNENLYEQLICEVTGHRSNAVRGYKRTSSDQLKNISNVLYGQNKDKVVTEPMQTDHVDVKKPKVEINVPQQTEKQQISVNVNVNFN